MPIQYFTMEVPFEQKIDEEACSEDMISGSFLSLDQYHITVVPDESGEDRLIDLAAEFPLLSAPSHQQILILPHYRFVKPTAVSAYSQWRGLF